MIIFLYGSDGYRLKQNLDKIMGEYQKKHAGSMAFYSLDFGDDTNSQLDKLDSIFKTVGFFDEKQLIIAQGAFAVADKILELIKKWNPAEDKERVVVFAENETGPTLNKKSKKLFSMLSEKRPSAEGMVKEFEPLEGKQLENWLVKEAEVCEISIEPAAAKKLVDYVGADSWRLAVEIEKLANYAAAGDIKRITDKDIELLVLPNVDLNIFEMLDQFVAKNKARLLVLLAKHLKEGSDPYYLFSMFAYQFRNMLKVKSLSGKYLEADAIAKKTGLHPYVVKKMLGQLAKHDLDEIKCKFLQIADGDIAIKNGEIDPVDFLYKIALG